MKRLLSFLPRLWTNWITLFGTMITTVAGCTIVLALAAEVVSPSPNPYTSAVAFLLMPMTFLFGLMIIPVGLWWESFKRKRSKKTADDDPIKAAFREALQNKTARRKILFVGVLTFVNLVIVGGAGHQALVFMDSPEFCGNLCHSVMAPEYDAYVRSPHSRVNCVDCHIGPGASWAVKAKISGLRQVWAVTVGNFSRPIPAPVQHLRPARDTCEKCHWPAKFHGNRVAFSTRFKEDEKNSPEVTAILLKVGGEDPRTGKYHGIHWHVSPDVEVLFEVLDDKREKLGKVTWKEKGEVKEVYQPKNAGGEVKEERLMDCVDCHNRPTHIYDASPGAAVDRSLAEGKLDGNIPFLRKVAVQAISPIDIDRDQAEEIITKALVETYAKDHPEVKLPAGTLEKTAVALADLYRENIYPDLKIEWDTYPSHLGHRGEEVDTRGCFRCHDEKHETEGGKTLSQDCDICHEILHEDEPLEELPESLQALLSVHFLPPTEEGEKKPADEEKPGDDAAPAEPATGSEAKGTKEPVGGEPAPAPPSEPTPDAKPAKDPEPAK